MILDRMYLVIVYHVQISKLQIPSDDSRQNVPGYCISCTDIKTADTSDDSRQNVPGYCISCTDIKTADTPR